MTNYTQDYIKTLNDEQKVELFDELYFKGIKEGDGNVILDWGVSVMNHPTIDEDDEIMEDFKLLYINNLPTIK